MTITKDAMAAIGSAANLSLWTIHREEVVAGDFTVTTAVAMNAYTPDKVHPISIQIR